MYNLYVKVDVKTRHFLMLLLTVHAHVYACVYACMYACIAFV
jgi:hypothetical protein